jgi:hypothetical protein
LNVLKLMKAARSISTPEELTELLGALGVTAEYEPIAMETEPAAAELRLVAQAAVANGQKLFKVSLKSEQVTLMAFVVLKQT